MGESVSDEARSVDVVASTDDIDGHGTIVRQNWRLERFAENPVVLYAHDHWDLPIGTASKVGVVDGKLRATITFSAADLNPKADLIWKNVKAGVLRGVSAGFRPHSVTFEKHEDRDVMILDDNELFELTVTPCPSNAAALAEMRSMHAPAPETTSPPANDGPAKTEDPPIPKEATIMADKPNDPTNTVSVARALGLPAGATEQDAITRSVALREIEVQLLAITGEKSVDGAIGAIRGMAGAADKLKSAQAELATVKAERDTQNFEALIKGGRAEHKLTPAEEKYERELFAKAVEDGRTEARIAELTGYLKVKAPDPRMARSVKQPEGHASAGEPLLWDGKAYKDLAPKQRARLSQENPELFRLMKDDHDAAGAAA